MQKNLISHDKAENIRKYHAKTGATHQQLADMFRISKSSVLRCLHYRRKKENDLFFARCPRCDGPVEYTEYSIVANLDCQKCGIRVQRSLISHEYVDRSDNHE